MAVLMNLVLVGSLMQLRTNSVTTSTSMAGTRPLPSERRSRRMETTARSSDASWMRMLF